MLLNSFFLISLSASVVFLLIAVRRRSRLAGAICCFLCLVTLLTFAVRRQQQPVAPADAHKDLKLPPPPDPKVLDLADLRPIEEAAEGYVTSETCRECHSDQHATWRESYHRTMTQVATPAAVIGDFADRSVTADGRTYVFQRQGNTFWVNMNDPDEESLAEAARAWCPVALTTGSHHMQIYWYPAGQGRLLCQVPLVYLVEEKRWVPRTSVFLVPPGEPLSSEAGRWNETCINCHTTRGRPRIFDATRVDSRATEFGISCEACHGPGEQHVQFHTALEASETDRAAGSDAIVNPAELSHALSSQVCGHCHSVANSLTPRDVLELMIQGDRYRPGQPLGESLRLIRRDDATRQYLRQFKQYSSDDEAIEQYFDMTFWPDGMVRVSGREYSGLVESACFQQGEMSCVSCHQLHKSEDDTRSMKQWANDQLQPGLRSDRACTQCHGENRYTSEQHTHHAAESAGSRCYNCHMPHTSYGLLKAIRSHEISNPDTSTSLQTGRPDACNLCHLDQTLQWSARHLWEWYGTEIPALDEDQKSVSAAVLWTLTGDAGQRALLAWSMGWEPAVEVSGSDWLPPYLITLLEDPYDAVRFIAARSLRQRRGFENFEYDFVSAEDDRQRAAERALEIWKNRDMRTSSGNPRVLIDSAGRLQRKHFQRLKGMRDDRDVQLQE